MPIVNSSSGGFYTDRIGTTDDGFPVYLYFDPAAAAFRPTVVPPAGNPYYASAETRILHETAQVSPVASAVVLGTIGAILGGAPGAAIGTALGIGLSRLTAHSSPIRG